MMGLRLSINGKSKHGNEFPAPSGGWNETNPGLGIGYEWAKDKIIKEIVAGYYKNSLNKNTGYVGGSYRKRFGNDYYLDAGLSGGALIGGYDIPVVPFMAPSLSIGKKGLGSLNFMYAPKTSRSPSFWMMNGEIPFEAP